MKQYLQTLGLKALFIKSPSLRSRLIFSAILLTKWLRSDAKSLIQMYLTRNLAHQFTIIYDN